MCGDGKFRLFILCDLEGSYQPAFITVVLQALLGLQRLMHGNIPFENGHFDADPMVDEMGRGDLQPFGVVRFGRGEFLDG